ncbi:MAG: hypothetical protein EB133_12250 [Betaproteobacteria bacterium]|nr:hypothetical protein [Betaproteobacteria bacterium]
MLLVYKVQLVHKEQLDLKVQQELKELWEPKVPLVNLELMQRLLLQYLHTQQQHLQLHTILEHEMC